MALKQDNLGKSKAPLPPGCGKCTPSRVIILNSKGGDVQNELKVCKNSEGHLTVPSRLHSLLHLSVLASCLDGSAL